MAVQTRIQIRRGTLAQWVASAQTLGNGILYQGEIGYETDTGRFKIGDGSTAWSSLSYSNILPSNFIAGSGVTLTQGTNGSTLTIGLSNPTIQVSNITDFAEGVDDRVASLLTQGSGIGLTYNDSANTLQVAVTGIPSSLITNFASSVNDLIDSAVSTSIVAGSGVDIVYNSGNNTLTVSSSLTAGSGIAVSHSSGNYTISLSDPTIQLADITDLTSNARNFLLTPSSSNLSTLVSDETGTGSLVFSNNPTFVGPTLGAASATSINNVAITNPAGTATLTLGSSKTFTVSNTLTLTGTDNSSVEFGNGGTVAYTGNNLGVFASTTSSQLAGVISDETGSGPLVFANNPTMSGVTINGNLTVGGSGLIASNINDFNTAVRTNRLDQMAVPTADVSLNSQKITNLADPVSAQDAATKAYVDAARSGLDVKQSVRLATTPQTEYSIGGAMGGFDPVKISGSTIDGVTPNVGDRVLIKNTGVFGTISSNRLGIYTVVVASTYIELERASDADSSAEVTAGMFTFVTEGTTNADSGWVLTTNDTITLGTTALAFAQFSGAGQITAGAGLTKSGNTIDVVTASSSRIVVNADNIDLATVSQSNSSGSAGINFVQSTSVDSYGRVTGVTTADVRDATTSVKGIASFDSGDFSVTSGAVSIKSGGVDNSQLANSSVTIGSSSVSLGGTLTAVSGLSSVTSTSFVGALTGNSSTATTLQTSRTINGTSFNGSADITIAFVDGGTP